MKAIINILAFCLFAFSSYSQSMVGFVNGKLITGQGTASNDAVTYEQLGVQLTAMSPRYKARLQCDTNGDLTVTFPANTFDVGIIPVLSFEVEAPATDAATYAYFVNVVQPPTNTSVVLKVTRSLKTPVISILGALNLFTTPGANKAWVHIIAVTPS